MWICNNVDLTCNKKKRRHLLETFFYIVTNIFTLSLDNDPQTIRSIMKNEKLLRTVILFIENIFYNRFGKSVYIPP